MSVPKSKFTVQDLFLNDTGFHVENGQQWNPTFIGATARKHAEDENLNHEYIPFVGAFPVRQTLLNALIGSELAGMISNRTVNLQTISGITGLHLGSRLLRTINLNTVYFADPTYETQIKPFLANGFSDIRTYRYVNASTGSIDFSGLIEDLSNAPSQSIVVLQARVHNPTGCDPTKSQWTKIADVMQRRSLVPFFDVAQLGFVSGDPEKDAWPVRFFIERGFELLCAQQFREEMGIYNTVGHLVVVQRNTNTVLTVERNLSRYVTQLYLNPAGSACKLVCEVLNDATTRSEWLADISEIRQRVKRIRQLLNSALLRHATPNVLESVAWKNICDQVGPYAYFNMNVGQTRYLAEKHKMHIMSDGRINLSALNEENVDRVAKALSDANKCV